MSGPGRPTAARAANRRRRVLAALASSVASLPKAVEAIAAKVGASAATVRGDLEALRAEAELEPEADAVPPALAKQLEAAKTPAEIAAALGALVSASLRGLVTQEQARLALDAQRVVARAAGAAAPAEVAPEPGERPELARARATGLSDRQIEQRVPGGLPQGFLSKARSGGHTGARSEGSWSKLRAWLDEVFPAPAGTPSSPSSAGASAASAEILALIEGSKDFGTLDALSKRLLRATFAEEIPEKLGRLMIDATKERRQVLERALEEQRAIDSRKPVEIRIVWVNEWRKKVDAAVASVTTGKDSES